MQHGNVGFLHNAWSSDDNVIIECRQEITNLLWEQNYETNFHKLNFQLSLGF